MSWSFVVFVIVLVIVDQFVAYHSYKYIVRRNEKKFLAHARLKFPEAVITLSTVATTDLDALEQLLKELDNLPDAWDTTEAYIPLSTK